MINLSSSNKLRILPRFIELDNNDHELYMSNRKRNRSPSHPIQQQQQPNLASLFNLNLGQSSNRHLSINRSMKNINSNNLSLITKPSTKEFSSISGFTTTTTTTTTTSSDSDQQPPSKRRKGLAGTILSTAIDAALFTSAVGYAAYQYWTGRKLEEEEEAILSLKSSFSKPVTSPTSLPSLSPPPPYESVDSVKSQQSDCIQVAQPPNKPTSKTRSISRPRPRRSSRTVTHNSNNPINFILRPTNHFVNKSYPQGISTHQDDKELMSDFVSSLKPYPEQQSALNERNGQEEDEDYDECEDDVEMRAFNAQIQGLIKEGQAALASKPTISNSLGAEHSSRFLQTNCTPPSVMAAAVSQLPIADHNVSLLQAALEKAANGPDTNWWERQ